jgi:hypothetical protein
MGLALAAIVLTVSGGGAYAFAATSSAKVSACVHHKGGVLYSSRKCAKHDKRMTWNVTGPEGQPGPRGPQGQPGPQGPGAVEYTYDSTAPAATLQNTPLGPAGPFSELTGSCTVSGINVKVTLGETNSNNVLGDETQNWVANGGTPQTNFYEISWVATSSPVTLLEASSNNVGDSFSHTTLTVTSPSHGTLDIFEQVSHANNTCHVSVVWTPAS